MNYYEYLEEARHKKTSRTASQTKPTPPPQPSHYQKILSKQNKTRPAPNKHIQNNIQIQNIHNYQSQNKHIQDLQQQLIHLNGFSTALLDLLIHNMGLLFQAKDAPSLSQQQENINQVLNHSLKSLSSMENDSLFYVLFDPAYRSRLDCLRNKHLEYVSLQSDKNTRRISKIQDYRNQEYMHLEAQHTQSDRMAATLNPPRPTSQPQPRNALSNSSSLTKPKPPQLPFQRKNVVYNKHKHKHKDKDKDKDKNPSQPNLDTKLQSYLQQQKLKKGINTITNFLPKQTQKKKEHTMDNQSDIHDQHFQENEKHIELFFQEQTNKDTFQLNNIFKEAEHKHKQEQEQNVEQHNHLNQYIKNYHQKKKHYESEEQQKGEQEENKKEWEQEQKEEEQEQKEEEQEWKKGEQEWKKGEQEQDEQKGEQVEQYMMQHNYCTFGQEQEKAESMSRPDHLDSYHIKFIQTQQCDSSEAGSFLKSSHVQDNYDSKKIVFINSSRATQRHTATKSRQKTEEREDNEFQHHFPSNHPLPTDHFPSNHPLTTDHFPSSEQQLHSNQEPFSSGPFESSQRGTTETQQEIDVLKQRIMERKRKLGI